ncbi:MAG: ATP-binding protein [Burkholderiales bacterium]|nr:ATP-binding protein [Burkholderiales bacterium]
MGTELYAPARIEELSIGASSAEVRRASDWLDTACRQLEVPQRVVERIVLCVNEVLANVIAHGGEAARSAPIRLLLEVGLDQDGRKASVTVSDAGVAFNPLTVPEKRLPKSLDEASPGGLGLVMIRRCSDWQHYRHEDGRNYLSCGTRWMPE